MLRKVVDCANVTVAVLTGAYLVLVTLFRTDGLRAVPTGLSTGGLGLLCFFIGAFLLGANLYFLKQEWRMGNFRQNLFITTDHGQNELHVAALEMRLVRDLRADPEIVEPAVTLIPQGEGKPMQCKVELKLRHDEERDIVSRTDRIMQRVREDIERIVTGGITVDISVKVKDIVSDAPRGVQRSDTV